MHFALALLSNNSLPYERPLATFGRSSLHISTIKLLIIDSLPTMDFLTKPHLRRNVCKVCCTRRAGDRRRAISCARNFIFIVPAVTVPGSRRSRFTRWGAAPAARWLMRWSQNSNLLLTFCPLLSYRTKRIKQTISTKAQRRRIRFHTHLGLDVKSWLTTAHSIDSQLKYYRTDAGNSQRSMASISNREITKPSYLYCYRVNEFSVFTLAAKVVPTCWAR